MFSADAPALETNCNCARIERLESRHAVDDHQPMHVELQLHQELVAKGSDEVAGVGSAAYMTDFDMRASNGGRVDTARSVEARQVVLDRAQCPQHLAGQEELGASLASTIVSMRLPNSAGQAMQAGDPPFQQQA
jgi:hypothetical protein